MINVKEFYLDAIINDIKILQSTCKNSMLLKYALPEPVLPIHIDYKITDARKYLEEKLWNGTPVCPFCGCDKWYQLKDNKTYKCGNRKCHKKYTVTVGTIFQSSHIPLNLWFIALYIIACHEKGITASRLARYINITPKSAAYIIDRLRFWFNRRIPK